MWAAGVIIVAVAGCYGRVISSIVGIIAGLVLGRRSETRLQEG